MATYICMYNVNDVINHIYGHTILLSPISNCKILQRMIHITETMECLTQFCVLHCSTDWLCAFSPPHLQSIQSTIKFR